MDENTIGINFIDTVIDRSACKKHKASVDTPCWVVETAKGDWLRGVCNKRAIKAGYNGKISRSSLRVRSSL